MRAVLLVAVSGLLSACASLHDEAAETTEVAGEAMHPFIGCWDSANGLSREGWTIDPSGWLVGYSANRNAANEVTFFESMRVERTEGEADVLVVTGPSDATVRFQRDMTQEDVYRFVNADHDFPQVITYRPSPGRLDAEISALDGSNRVEFLKAACD